MVDEPGPGQRDIVGFAEILLTKDTEEDELEARKLFVEATQKDPNFLEAHLAVASTFARAATAYMAPAEAALKADEAVAKATAIDPNNIGSARLIL